MSGKFYKVTWTEYFEADSEGEAGGQAAESFNELDCGIDEVTEAEAYECAPWLMPYHSTAPIEGPIDEEESDD